ncbi:sn-glycerol-1-phosphate dehydrogenase [Spirochaeta isovalerica]|uniref:Glycerol-1-phosphate dehydrogenase [NAD(P)+] n=1 Tax=Spirochaeta isovalerica TaxID=150 RepID=A0A841RFN1_9SPIO|nr:sn-glycerol-1-phosphate dehydrogenase [Spirochaeta isovalerica]MBB6481378.1 glycerol-1-phosphate dehydrogenase [NAD(P)+] [Spirochaeta isovalerica]
MNSIEQFRKFADSTKYLYVGSDIYSRMISDFLSFTEGRPVYIIADENTMDAAGNRFLQFCRDESVPVAGLHRFSAEPELTSDYENVIVLKDKLSGNYCVPVAVGSGTINDLVKRTAYELNRPYAVVATAGSVDGYASDGAALLYNGLKQTLPCSAPCFICADTAVLSKAPREMTSAGYADLLAKNPAGADWLIADTVGLDFPEPDVWSMIQGNLPEWTGSPENLLKGDSDAFIRLFTGLNATGFAMQYMKRSRPASGAEHLMSHIWEMDGHTFRGKHVSHGFKVAIGSLASIALMETVLSMKPDGLQIDSALEQWPSFEEKLAAVEKHFTGTGAIDDLLKINREKYISHDELKTRLFSLKDNWGVMAEKVFGHLIPYRRYRDLLERAGCPVVPEAIGLTVEKVMETYYPAQLMRNRYTILDLAVETASLEKACSRIAESRLYLK